MVDGLIRLRLSIYERKCFF